MNTKTELDERFELKDDRNFALHTLLAMAVSFIVGMIIASFLIFFCLSLID